MGNVYFFTGFPGFLASHLIRDIFKNQFEVEKVFLLILPDTKAHAEQLIIQLSTDLNLPQHTFELITGDITKDNLDLTSTTSQKLLSTITHAFHLAAIYDLAVEEKLAYKVNVIGTKNINQWLLHAERLQRYVYFSTAYVSGKREGIIYEEELKHNKGFKNHYESTKYQAEVLVEDCKSLLPVTIIRPGIAIGNSKSGETTKFDGPYFILNLFERMKFLPSIPYFGHGEAEANFIPVDYVVQATVFLSHFNNSVGKTYHLTDPNPYRTKDAYRMLMEALLGQTPGFTVPLSIAKASLAIPAIRKWLNIQQQTLPYFTNHTHYDTAAVENDLKGSGIQCPDLETVLPAMIRYYREHKEDPEKKITVR